MAGEHRQRRHHRLIGTSYDVDDLLAARGGRDWIGLYGGWLLALLLLALLLSAIHLVTLFTARPRTVSRGERGEAEKIKISASSASPRAPREPVPSP